MWNKLKTLRFPGKWNVTHIKRNIYIVFLSLTSLWVLLCTGLAASWKRAQPDSIYHFFFRWSKNFSIEPKPFDGMKRVHTKYIHHVQHFSLLFLPLFSFILRIWWGFFARSLAHSLSIYLYRLLSLSLFFLLCTAPCIFAQKLCCKLISSQYNVLNIQLRISYHWQRQKRFRCCLSSFSSLSDTLGAILNGSTYFVCTMYNVHVYACFFWILFEPNERT